MSLSCVVKDRIINKGNDNITKMSESSLSKKQQQEGMTTTTTTATSNNNNNHYGDFQTDRMIIKPWKFVIDVDNANDLLLSELDTILDEDVTSFLPPTLVYKRGVSSIIEWCKAFHSDDANVSTIRLIDNGNEKQSSLAGVLLIKGSSSDATTENTEETQELHIGYIFGKKFWGKGLATELLTGLMNSFTKNKFKGCVVGGVDPNNIASSRVLIKVGFIKLMTTDDTNRPKDVDWYIRKFF